MLKTGWLVSLCTILFACSHQSSLINLNDETDSKLTKDILTNEQIQARTDLRYICKDNKEVRITKVTKNEQTKRNTVTVHFNGRSQNLVENISEAGKNYTNIYWRWYERKNYSTLSTSVGEILAEQCELQK